MIKFLYDAKRLGALKAMGFDAEQLLSSDLLSLVRVMNQVGLILAIGQGLGPPKSILTWGG